MTFSTSNTKQNMIHTNKRKKDKLKKLIETRDTKREKMTCVFLEYQRIKKERDDIEYELSILDDEIDELESVLDEYDTNTNYNEEEEERLQCAADEYLEEEEEAIQQQQRQHKQQQRHKLLATQAEEHLSEVEDDSIINDYVDDNNNTSLNNITTCSLSPILLSSSIKNATAIDNNNISSSSSNEKKQPLNMSRAALKPKTLQHYFTTNDNNPLTADTNKKFEQHQQKTQNIFLKDDDDDNNKSYDNIDINPDPMHSNTTMKEDKSPSSGSNVRNPYKANTISLLSTKPRQIQPQDNTSSREEEVEEVKATASSSIHIIEDTVSFNPNSMDPFITTIIPPVNNNNNSNVFTGNSLAPPCSFFAMNINNSNHSSSQRSNSHNTLLNNATTPITTNYHNLNLSSDRYPWSNEIQQLLQNTFNIPSFRKSQDEIINGTLLQKDSFVIMRTGGGKSLCYQLPALYNHIHYKQITVVISPLLSLIRDQIDQMNAFTNRMHTAISLSDAKHKSIWKDVLTDRSHNNVCLVYTTPEKIHKSTKIKHDFEKLYAQNKIGLFVIDEAHCATQWGHDFRPDYTKLGILKYHFPKVPLMAVTATASKKVRDDCCRILNLDLDKTMFFVGSANRPNLTYTILEKPDGGIVKFLDKVLSFLKSKQYDPHSTSGIIYTFSRKDADDIAHTLSSPKYNIIAASYHSDIPTSTKDSIHSAWMRNDIQIVVATIAFGLGINKPDVRFVCHHTLSKSLESYYQESGRAGRDGSPADCILFYSTKDVARMLCMIHGTKSENSFWSMVRYGQEFGNDEVCRNIMLRCLGETPPSSSNSAAISSPSSISTSIQMEERDVTLHAKTVTQLVTYLTQECGGTITQPQLVTQWRSKNPIIPQSSSNNSTATTQKIKNLTKDECDRLIISLFLLDILHPKIACSNPYNSSMYVIPGTHANKLLQDGSTAVVKVKFPVRGNNKTNHNDGTTSSSTKKKKKTTTAAATASNNSNKWLSTTTSTKKASKTPTTARRKNVTKKKSTTKKKKENEIIELSSSSSNNDDDDFLSDDDDDILIVTSSKRKRRKI